MKTKGKVHIIGLSFLALTLVITACNPATSANPTATSTQTSQPIQSTTAAPQTTAQPSQTVKAPTETAAPTSEPSGSVTSFPDPSQFEWRQIVTGLVKPTAMIELPDGSGRLLVLEQHGDIRIVDNAQVLQQPFLNIASKVGSQGNEQGLLGMALDPNYANTGIFYLNYTDVNGNTVVARYHTKSDGSAADPASEQILLHIDQPYANHNGGNLTFGPDGMLYIGMGDGGSGGDPKGNAQNLNTLLGKMLRIDVSGQSGYTIPKDNPFASGGGLPEIWAYGLRNPWRFSFDKQTGDLYIGDVGQNQFEEIDFVAAGTPPGLNFGWNFREGLHPYKGTPPAGLVLTDPVFEYPHSQGCSVTGGYVYRGKNLPEFNGIYLFGDYCTGRIWGMLHGADGTWQVKELFKISANISSFGQDERDELYLLDHSGGVIYYLDHK